jgi:HPt (histidine-containing phosphotransfer) domain-containing protein
VTARDADFADAAFEAQIEALRQHYLQGMPERRAALAEAWRGCGDGGEEQAWLSLRDVAHKLSGSAPCYGLEAVGEAARDLDKLLSGRTPCRTRAQVQAEVERLQALLDAIPGC